MTSEFDGAERQDVITYRAITSAWDILGQGLRTQELAEAVALAFIKDRPGAKVTVERTVYVAFIRREPVSQFAYEPPPLLHAVEDEEK